MTPNFYQSNPVHAAAGENEVAVVRSHHVTHDTAA